LLPPAKARLAPPSGRALARSEPAPTTRVPRHWQEFYARTHADRERHVHVAASLFHDIAPAQELGVPTVWVNRLGEQADPEPTREIDNLTPLPDVLDQLVPA